MLRSTWLKDLLLLTLITSLFFGIFLGSRNLSAPDELRYSEIPREMIVNQDYVVPMINGVKYFEKPPLFYWMQVASIKTLGLNDWSLRFTTALMGLLGVLATYLFTRRLYDRKTAWLASLIISSMSLYFSMAHVITLDMTVSVFVTMSLYLFFLAIKNKRSSWMALGFVAAAAAMMTKGLIAIIFPTLIIGLWLSLFNRWRQLNIIALFFGLAVFLILVAPWHILLQLRAPEFFHFYFIEQQFLRYATAIAHRSQPAYFYIPVILLGTLPWSVFLPKALAFLRNCRWKNRWQYENELFFMLWFLCVFLFFSVSNSKLIPYVLPGLPPLAILIARYLGMRKKNNLFKPVIIVYLASNLALITALVCVDYFDNHTIKTLIFKVRQDITAYDEIVAYHGYHQDLPFYFQRIVTVDESFDELRFGAEHGNTQEWMINEKEFKKRWLSERTLYIFLKQNQYDEFIDEYPENTGRIVAKEKNNLVIVNHLTQGVA
jgi:4-amino-4-deoxy-L-arabinose transferase-like glycosyltransferase